MSATQGGVSRTNGANDPPHRGSWRDYGDKQIRQNQYQGNNGEYIGRRPSYFVHRQDTNATTEQTMSTVHYATGRSSSPLSQGSRLSRKEYQDMTKKGEGNLTNYLKYIQQQGGTSPFATYNSGGTSNFNAKELVNKYNTQPATTPQLATTPRPLEFKEFSGSLSPRSLAMKNTYG